ncbi:hypothetical protein D4Z76_09490, partial [Campylobacter coli]
SPHCNGQYGLGPGQREGGSKGVDAEDTFGPAAAGRKGELEANCARSSALLQGPKARDRTQHGPCPWPALPTPSWLQGSCPIKGQAARRLSRHARVPSQAHPR